MQGLYAPTAEDLEAMQSNRANAMQASSIAGIIAHIPQMRKQKKASQYWSNYGKNRSVINCRYEKID